jgi:hypothetical protein
MCHPGTLHEVLPPHQKGRLHEASFLNLCKSAAQIADANHLSSSTLQPIAFKVEPIIFSEWQWYRSAARARLVTKTAMAWDVDW